MRVREQITMPETDTLATIRHQLRGFYQSDWVQVGDTDYHGKSGSASTYMEDVVTPHFKRESARGSIIESNMLRRVTEKMPPQPVPFSKHYLYEGSWDNGYPNYEWITATLGAKWDGAYVPFSLGNTAPGFLGLGVDAETERQRLIDLAVTKAHANVDQSEMLALATLGEASKTVDFLAHNLKKVALIARKARKLEFANIYHMTKFRKVREIEEQYMALRYAVRPLIYDVNGVIKALYKTSLIQKRPRKTFRGMETASFTNRDEVIGVSFFAGTSCEVSRYAKLDIKARAGVLADVNVDRLSPFGGDKIIETAWELMPFSFIIDWFANVGTTIGAWAPKAGVNLLTSWVTTTEDLMVVNSVQNLRSSDLDILGQITNSVSCGPVSWYENTSTTRRQVVPVLRTWPKIDINLNTYKLYDLGIILKKTFRR